MRGVSAFAREPAKSIGRSQACPRHTIRIVPAVDLHVTQHLFGVSTRHLQRRDPINHVDCKTETVNLILDGQIKSEC